MFGRSYGALDLAQVLFNRDGVDLVELDCRWHADSLRLVFRTAPTLMPHATICLGCGRITGNAPKGRCPSCQRERDRNDFYQSPEWRQLAARAKADACDICAGSERLTAHHSHARRDGGPDKEDNIVTLCGSCHSQYEADKRAGKDTELRRLVDAL